MKEEYLNYLWKTKNIPLQNLILTDGRPITISSFGFHNKDSGPDFSNGSIIIDGITWVGNIEIHINASDWYAHNHHSDKAYNNVILHVVYNNDKPVYINNEIIPTLELKALIPKNHLDNYSKMISNSKWIPCFDTFNHVDSIHIKNQIDVAVFQRLERKIKSISDRIWILNFDVNQLIIELVAGVLGTNVNRLPMLELVQRKPMFFLKNQNQTFVHYFSKLQIYFRTM